jgi:hypothetical protein
MRQRLMLIAVLLGVAIPVDVIVAPDGEFFPAPPALQCLHAVASAAPAA